MKCKLEQFPAKNPNPVLSVTQDGTILYSNEAGKPILHEWSVGVGEKLPSYIGDIVKNVISRNSPEKMEVKTEKKVYLVAFHPVLEEKCVNIYGFDISDQKELEEKLRDSEEKYKVIFDNSLDGIFITIPDGTILAANPAACHMFEMTEEEIIQAGRNGTVDTSDPRLKSVLEERARAGKFKGELNHRRKDGTIFPSEISSTLFKDKNGLTKVVMVIRDISERKKAENTLQESEERFRSAFEDSAVAMALVGPDARFLKVNDAFCRLLGFEKSEMESRTFLDFTYPDDMDPSILTHKAVINHEKPFFWLEKRYIRKDGKVIWCEVSSSPVQDSKGCTIYTVAHVQDITERKKAEEALKQTNDNLDKLVKERTAQLEKAYKSLKESEEGLAEAQKMAHIGNWDWDIETDKAYWSEELYRIYGRDPQELAPSYNEYLSYVHPDDRDYADNAHKKALNGKTFSIDHRIILSNGEVRTIHMKTKVIFNEKKIPIKLKGTVQDITERKGVEEKLRESEEKYRNIVETANEGILITDNENIITYVNQKLAHMLGYTVEEVIGKQIWIFISEEYRPIVGLKLEKRRQGISESYELKSIRKDGSPLWTFLNAKPLLNKGGKYVGSMSMLTDITERKKAEQALNNIETARKKEIHHRIKNNLQVISSLLDLQAEQFRNLDNIKDSEVLEAFRESQDRVISMALIHEELYKGEEFETLNFSLYIQELAENLFHTYRLGNANVSLNLDLEENIFFDMDVAVPLGIIINELVSNSLKYAFSGRDKGEIRIKLRREEKGECKSNGCKSTSFTLTVSDNGVGIPENLDIEEIASLGLQLVTSLVDQLDGELELKRNKGTEFIIRFTVTEKDNLASNPVIS